MADLLTSLKDYCAELGGDPEVWMDPEAKERLPLFLAQSYEPVHCRIFGRSLRLLISKKRGHQTPAELESHAQLAGRQLGENT